MITNNNFLSKQWIFLGLIIVLSFFLSGIGLNWGLPDGSFLSHTSSNTDDENHILRDTNAVLSIFRGEPETIRHHSFYFQEGWIGHYVRLGFLGTAYLFDFIHFDDFDNQQIGGYQLENARNIVLVARLVSFFSTVSTVLLVYYLVSKFWGANEALIAAFITTILSGQVVFSHFAKSNPLASFFATTALYFALLWRQVPLIKWAVLAGVFAGLAGGARINALSSISILGLALIFSQQRLSSRDRLIGLVLGCLTAGIILMASYPQVFFQFKLPHFGVGNPWMNWQFDWAGFMVSFWHVINGWVGIELLLLALIWGVTKSIFERDFDLLVVVVWVIFYCILIAKTAVPQPRYFSPILPSVAIIIGVGYQKLSNSISNENLKRIPRGGLWIALLVMLAFSMAFVNVFSHEDTKINASRWIEDNVLENAVIGIPAWEGDHRLRIDETKYIVLYGKPHPTHPDLATKNDHPALTPDYILVPDNQIKSNPYNLDDYHLIMTIRQPLEIFGLQFNDQFPEEYKYVARWHDKFHASIQIFQRQDLLTSH
jgi:hypothetical protein